MALNADDVIVQPFRGSENFDAAPGHDFDVVDRRVDMLEEVNTGPKGIELAQDTKHSIAQAEINNAGLGEAASLHDPSIERAGWMSHALKITHGREVSFKLCR